MTERGFYRLITALSSYPEWVRYYEELRQHFVPFAITTLTVKDAFYENW
jgi:hypothetical protein